MPTRSNISLINEDSKKLQELRLLLEQIESKRYSLADVVRKAVNKMLNDLAR